MIERELETMRKTETGDRYREKGRQRDRDRDREGGGSEGENTVVNYAVTPDNGARPGIAPRYIHPQPRPPIISPDLDGRAALVY